MEGSWPDVAKAYCASTFAMTLERSGLLGEISRQIPSAQQERLIIVAPCDAAMAELGPIADDDLRNLCMAHVAIGRPSGRSLLSLGGQSYQFLLDELEIGNAHVLQTVALRQGKAFIVDQVLWSLCVTSACRSEQVWKQAVFPPPQLAFIPGCSPPSAFEIHARLIRASTGETLPSEALRGGLGLVRSDGSVRFSTLSIDHKPSSCARRRAGTVAEQREQSNTFVLAFSLVRQASGAVVCTVRQAAAIELRNSYHTLSAAEKEHRRSTHRRPAGQPLADDHGGALSTAADACGGDTSYSADAAAYEPTEPSSSSAEPMALEPMALEPMGLDSAHELLAFDALSTDALSPDFSDLLQQCTEWLPEGEESLEHLHPLPSSALVASAGGTELLAAPKSSLPERAALPAVGCWGGDLKQDDGAGCSPGFVPGHRHLKTKLCERCQASLSLPAARVRVLPASVHARFANSEKGGVWNQLSAADAAALHGSSGMPGSGGTHGMPNESEEWSRSRWRLVNHTASCTQPRLLICDSVAPSPLGWPPLPQLWVHADKTVRFVARHGTLVPLPRVEGAAAASEPVGAPPLSLPLPLPQPVSQPPVSSPPVSLPDSRQADSRQRLDSSSEHAADMSDAGSISSSTKRARESAGRESAGRESAGREGADSLVQEQPEEDAEVTRAHALAQAAAPMPRLQRFVGHQLGMCALIEGWLADEASMPAEQVHSLRQQLLICQGILDRARSGDLFTAWRSGDGSAGGVDGGGDCAGGASTSRPGAGAAAGGELHLDQALGAVAMVASPPPPAAPNEPPISLRDLEMLCVLVGGSDFQQQQVARLHSHRTHAAFASATWHALTCYLAERTVYRIYVSFCTLMGYAPDEPSRRSGEGCSGVGRSGEHTPPSATPLSALSSSAALNSISILSSSLQLSASPPQPQPQQQQQPWGPQQAHHHRSPPAAHSPAAQSPPPIPAAESECWAHIIGTRPNEFSRIFDCLVTIANVSLWEDRRNAAHGWASHGSASSHPSSPISFAPRAFAPRAANSVASASVGLSGPEKDCAEPVRALEDHLASMSLASVPGAKGAEIDVPTLAAVFRHAQSSGEWQELCHVAGSHRCEKLVIDVSTLDSSLAEGLQPLLSGGYSSHRHLVVFRQVMELGVPASVAARNYVRMAGGTSALLQQLSTGDSIRDFSKTESHGSSLSTSVANLFIRTMVWIWVNMSGSLVYRFARVDGLDARRPWEGESGGKGVAENGAEAKGAESPRGRGFAQLSMRYDIDTMAPKWSSPELRFATIRDVYDESNESRSESEREQGSERSVIESMELHTDGVLTNMLTAYCTSGLIAGARTDLVAPLEEEA